MTFIDTRANADAFLAAIANVELLALDTEGASFHRFIDRIWLIQLATRDKAAILDPVTSGPMPALAALLASRDTEVVLHDASNDLRSIRQDYGWQVTRIFDTRIAAQLLGVPAFGLAALLADHFGVKLDKKHQRADWSMRPLSGPMLAYAAQDTAHLLALRDRLRAELQTAGRLAWAEEEFAALERPLVVDEEERTPAFLRVKGARELSPRSLTYFRELVGWREAIARTRDQAPFRVIGNEQLLALACDPPRTVADLSRIRGASPALFAGKGAELVEMAQGVRALADTALAAFPQHSGARDLVFEARFAKLKAVRDAAATKIGLDPGFVCGRVRLEAILTRNPKSLEELAAIDGVRRWNVEIMGAELVAALAD